MSRIAIHFLPTVPRSCITTASPEFPRAVVPVFKIPFRQREPFLRIQRLRFREGKPPSVEEHHSFVRNIAEEVLAYPNLFVHELDVVNDERERRVSDDRAHLPFQLPPHRQVVHLLLVLDDNQQIIVTFVARLLIVHPIAARTRTKQDEHVDRNRHIRTCEDSGNGLKFLLLVVGKMVD
jgi:hypothetical protein